MMGRVLAIIAIICCAGLSYAEDAPKGSVVLWISLDGVRSDYLSPERTPFLTQLMQEGMYSRQLAPAFPSVTFPSHVSQATGTPVAVHGVSGNKFYDSA